MIHVRELGKDGIICTVFEARSPVLDEAGFNQAVSLYGLTECRVFTSRTWVDLKISPVKILVVRERARIFVEANGLAQNLEAVTLNPGDVIECGIVSGFFFDKAVLSIEPIDINRSGMAMAVGVAVCGSAWEHCQVETEWAVTVSK